MFDCRSQANESLLERIVLASVNNQCQKTHKNIPNNRGKGENSPVSDVRKAFLHFIYAYIVICASFSFVLR